MKIVEEKIKPETLLERVIIKDPDFIDGVLWGK